MSLHHSLSGKFFKSSTRRQVAPRKRKRPQRRGHQSFAVKLSPSSVPTDFNGVAEEEEEETHSKKPLLDFLHGRSAVCPSKLRSALTDMMLSHSAHSQSPPPPPPPSSSSQLPPSSTAAESLPHKICHANKEYSVIFTARGIGMNFGTSSNDSTMPGYAISSVSPGTPAHIAGVQPHDRLLALSTLSARDMTTGDVGQFIRTSARPLTLRFLERDPSIDSDNNDEESGSGQNHHQHHHHAQHYHHHSQRETSHIDPDLAISSKYFNSRHLGAASRCPVPATPAIGEPRGRLVRA